MGLLKHPSELACGIQGARLAGLLGLRQRMDFSPDHIPNAHSQLGLHMSSLMYPR